jgi:hypothetical protein
VTSRNLSQELDYFWGLSSWEPQRSHELIDFQDLYSWNPSCS